MRKLPTRSSADRAVQPAEWQKLETSMEQGVWLNKCFGVAFILAVS